jgi:O-antigen/teichoic acid export membrane protein
MQKKRIITNTSAAVAQALFSAVLLFFLYRFLIANLGIEKLGIWSLVLATTSVSRISAFGLAGSIVPFVAKYLARDAEHDASRVIQTASISLAVLLGGLVFLLYPLFVWVLSKIIPGPEIIYALEILPYAMVSLVVGAIAGIYSSGLDACQRIDIRSLINIGSGVFYFLLVVLLVPDYALVGVAISQLSRAAIILFVTVIFLRRLLPTLPVIPYQWTARLFREMFSYGVKFQVITISMMLVDPVTKALMARYGSLSLVGYYEMSNRMLEQVRTLLMSANRVLVPVFATVLEKAGNINRLYLNSYSLMLYLAVPIFGAVVAAAPLISLLWIGKYEDVFVLFTMILVCGWVLNTLSYPAYFVGLGSEKLRANVVGYITMGIANVLFGLLLALYFGGIGVVVGRVSALLLGSAILVMIFHRDNRIGLSKLFRKEDRFYVLTAIAGATIAMVLYSTLTSQAGEFYAALLAFLSFFPIMGVAFWRHSMRARMFRWLGVRDWR